MPCENEIQNLFFQFFALDFEKTEALLISKTMDDLDEITKNKILDMYDKVWYDFIENAGYVADQSVGAFADEVFNEVIQK